ncbi:DUF2085 domain-containing protein [Desulfobulbus sp. AH-315-M07]|nr:DUF2085 domain-containing protein [Desulfobulbus sp. AH-315-M07]
MTAPSSEKVERELEGHELGRKLLRLVQVLLIAFGSFVWWLPLARALPLHSLLPLGPVGEIFDGVFIALCHRAPERTLLLAGVAQPVCSRCAGVYGGLALGALLRWPRPTMPQTRIALAVVGLLMAADVVMQDLALHPMWHSTRLVTGGLVGYALAASLMAAITRHRF